MAKSKKRNWKKSRITALVSRLRATLLKVLSHQYQPLQRLVSQLPRARPIRPLYKVGGVQVLRQVQKLQQKRMQKQNEEAARKSHQCSVFKKLPAPLALRALTKSR